jgi:hypothetical protein
MPYRPHADAILLIGLCGFAALGPANAQGSGWRLLRTPNPNGPGYAVSMSHTADMGRSDLDVAGLLLRCRETGDQATSTGNVGAPDATVEVAIVVVTPFPPRAQPAVTVSAPDKEWHFEARVIPPGAELLLPAEAAQLAAGPWQSTHELAVKVASQERSFSGVIPIDGLADALATLATNCPG